MFRQIERLAAREDFIGAMRRVAASVTVVTTDGPAGRAGATVSAFSSVSADPPTVLVCLHAQSRIATSVKENRIFCVNVLAEYAAFVADRFAGRHDGWIADRFFGIAALGPPGNAPVIDGATAFQCDLQRSVRAGSHLVCIGHVRAVLDGAVPPLAYCDGAYHKVILQARAAG